MTSLKKTTLFVIATFIVTTIATIVILSRLTDSPSGEGVVIAKIDSRILGERRELIVHLPESYERDRERRYPVVYVLDGSSQAVHTSSSAKLMARIGAMPEVIVVGIPSSDENRARDYTPPYMLVVAEEKNSAAGGADRFMEALEKELIPYIERSFRTTQVRMLAGHSRGGLFVVYSLLAKPELFHARFAFSPALWRDDSRIVSELQRSLASTVTAPTFLYVSLGDEENEKMTTAFERGVAVIRQAQIPGFEFKADVTRGADHSHNAELSTPVGFNHYARMTEGGRLARPASEASGTP